MKASPLFAALLGVACAGVSAQTADPALKLAQSKGCTACHAIDKKLVGPAYKDVAAKYAGKQDAVKPLVTKVMKGGSGVWGPIPMPPQQVTEAEATRLVQWLEKPK